MLYYQMPFYFFLGGLLYAFPDVAAKLGCAYLAVITWRIVR